jgi:hypothetical protein
MRECEKSEINGKYNRFDVLIDLREKKKEIKEKSVFDI